MEVGGVEERVVVEASPVAVQFNRSSSDITLERQLHRSGADQPAAIRTTWPASIRAITVIAGTRTRTGRTTMPTPTTTTPAAARAAPTTCCSTASPLGASYKTAYTPAVDAVEEITVSKNSVDAENGHSLGGIISLNMKSGTNALRGSALLLLPRPEPQLDQRSDDPVAPGQDTSALRGSELKMYGGTFGGPIKQNKIFSLHVVRAVGRQAAAHRSSARCRPSSSAAAISASRCSTAACARSTTRSRRRSIRRRAASCGRRSRAT